MRNRLVNRRRSSGRPFRGGGASAWTPAALTGYVDSPYSIAALREAGALWQNTAKTVPAVADSDPVRVAVCGSLEYTTPSDAARPTLTSEGGDLWSLEFDGVNDRLDVTSALFKLDSSLAVIARFRSAAASNYTLCGRAGTVLDREWQVRVAAAVGVQFNVSSDGGSFNGSISTGLAADTWGTFHGWYDLVAGETNARLSGAALDTDVRAVTTTNHAFAIGCDPTFGGAEFFSGRLAGLIVARAVPSAAEFALADAYLLALTP